MIVIKEFIDRESLKGYNVGDTFTHDNPERLKFLVSKGYLKEDKETIEEEPEEPKKAVRTSKTTAKTKTGTRTRKKG